MAHEAQASSSLKPALDKDSGARIDEIEGSGLTWRALAKKSDELSHRRDPR